MTVGVEERQTSEFSGGYTAGHDFAFSFRLHDATMLEVVIRTDGGEPIPADPSDYSVALNADQYVSPGGTVTFEPAVLSTETLQIRSNLSLQQQSDLTVSNTFNPRTVEDSVDYLMMCMQDTHRVSVTQLEQAAAAAAAAAGSASAAEASAAACVPAPFAVIDMAGDDYTMTDAESNASGKLVINAVAGKILLWPSTSDSTAPNKQTLAFLVAAPGLILQSESGGEAVLINSKIADLVYLPGAVVLIANSSIVSVKDIPETTYTLLDSDIGSMLRFTNGGAITLTINIEQITDGMNFSIEQAGAGQVSFDGTATLRNADSHTKTFGQFARVDFIQSGNNAMTFSGRTAA